MKTIESLANNVKALDSELFGDFYRNKYNQDTKEVLNTSKYRFNEIIELENEIFTNKYFKLSVFQIDRINILLKEFDKICDAIDPERLKNFSYSMNEFGEFYFTRKSTNGIANILIHDEDCVSFSYIPYNSKEESRIDHNETSDLRDFAFSLFKF